MRRLNKICMLRQQVRMSWSPLNCYNVIQRRPLNERHLNRFQIEWKSRAFCRAYFNGDVTEHVFRRIFNENHRNLFYTIKKMERRVDNVLFRCMFASSVFSARKMASSGMVLVNGERIWQPSLNLADGDVLQIMPSLARSVHRTSLHPMMRYWSFIPAYLEVNFATLSAIYLRNPEYDEIPNPYPRAMVESTANFYSKRG